MIIKNVYMLIEKFQRKVGFLQEIYKTAKNRKGEGIRNKIPNLGKISLIETII